MFSDPQDPHASLYDVDDGKEIILFQDPPKCWFQHLAETTVITLADWYHGLATQIFPNPTHVPPYVLPYNLIHIADISVVPPIQHLSTGWGDTAVDRLIRHLQLFQPNQERGIVSVSLVLAAIHCKLCILIYAKTISTK